MALSLQGLPTAISIAEQTKKPSLSINVSSLLSLSTTIQHAKQVHALMVKTSQLSESYPLSRLAEIYSISDHGNLQDAERIVLSMKEPSTFAWNTLIRDIGKQIHAQIIKLGNESGLFVRNKLIHFYAVSRSVTDARKVFDRSPELDIVSWNTMLEVYAGDGDSLSLYHMFDSMPCRDTVSWNTMISYSVKKSMYIEAVRLFRRMQDEGEEKPDKVTLISVLTAVAHSGSLSLGKWLHMYIKKQRMEIDGNLGSALVNMYSKCGYLDGAVQAFKETSEKNLDIWNSMIGCLAANARSSEAIDLFSEMDIRPDAITFACVLKACSHGGLVELGYKYFNEMKTKHGVIPDIVHYGCMVDLLGRAGLFDEVKAIMEEMPMEPDVVMWKALLSACKTHKEFEMGEEVGIRLIKEDPDDHANYVLLSNMYAIGNRWDQVHRLRKDVLDRGLKTRPGCSSIEVDGIVHEFIAGDVRHERKKEIYEMVHEMGKRLKEAGHEHETDQVLLDIEDEETKQISLGHHSEKLAVAFGFVSTRPGTTIRVIKNLRICGDCHSSFKIFSGIYGRDIIVRDSSRFHYFGNGSCSCLDCW
ncbi:pentatricopeptide repeat-containing protein At5g48910-like isoform X2 [Impatiens glandulifera]|uniref:pentatricopeptide repeat-containing protein At5g48910-like isoform X2 n=1 Tax=Impatiens glandulifera TaxID=253017 RepID=UPI001FB09107|nr:pentatricopeptide repeat-containing protein At5g48910-like isoform X2 [Impatiens glandulifera]